MVNSCSHDTQKLLHTIELDTPFTVVFLDFWEPEDIPDWNGSRNILTCLDCMIGFGLGPYTGMKEITSYQATQWNFGNLFVPFGLQKMIFADVDFLLAGILKKTFQETLLIPVLTDARG